MEGWAESTPFDEIAVTLLALLASLLVWALYCRRSEGWKRAELIRRLDDLRQELFASRRDEAALRAREARFRGILEKTKAGYFFIDPAGRFRQVNRAWLEMHGFDDPEEVIGKSLAITQVDDDLSRAIAIHRKIWRQGDLRGRVHAASQGRDHTGTTTIPRIRSSWTA